MGWYSLAEQQSQSCKALAPGNMSKWMKDWMLGTEVALLCRT